MVLVVGVRAPLPLDLGPPRPVFSADGAPCQRPRVGRLVHHGVVALLLTVALLVFVPRVLLDLLPVSLPHLGLQEHLDPQNVRLPDGQLLLVVPGGAPDGVLRRLLRVLVAVRLLVREVPKELLERHEHLPPTV